MSANNFILITKQDKPTVFYVEERDADTGEINHTISKNKTLIEEAIAEANKYIEDEEVEYGLRIVL